MTMGNRIAIMNQGVLQQVDTPQKLYDQPANTFVATFIGSPAMNILSGSLVGRDGAFRFTAEAIDLPVVHPPRGEPAGGLLLGIRPEAFERWPRTGAAPITGPVILIEPHGPDLFVTIDAGSQRVTARLDPAASVRPGEVIGLAPAGEPYHWFRAADGSRVEDAPAPAPRPPLAARLA
jgi:multiple sugar transport system ATP-binding protein